MDQELLETFFLDDLAARPTPTNARLPGRSENVVMDEPGYGDGGYPVYGGFAADGQLVAVHLDFNNAALTPSLSTGNWRPGYGECARRYIPTTRARDISN